MDHVHNNAEKNVYYFDQLCTIGFCGASGVVQILLWKFEVLDIILDPKFHLAVLLSGAVVTVLAVIRGIGLWIAVGRAKADQRHDCGHDQEHDHSHKHEHAISAEEHTHSHVCDHVHEHEHTHEDCGHDHGWAPWRYAVLMLPLILFMLGMPWKAEAEIDTEPLPPGVLLADFEPLRQAAYDFDTRNLWEGKLVRVKGAI